MPTDPRCIERSEAEEADREPCHSLDPEATDSDGPTQPMELPFCKRLRVASLDPRLSHSFRRVAFPQGFCPHVAIQQASVNPRLAGLVVSVYSPNWWQGCRLLDEDGS